MSPRPRWSFACLLAMVLLMVVATIPGPAHAAARCFPETGQCIDGRIREFWEQNGGLPVFGFPVAPQREEQVEGRPVQVQWFERNRLELHPEQARPYDVLLGRLGVDRLQQQGSDWFQFPKSQPQDGCRFFAETGHNVCGAIQRAWRASGLELDGRAGKSEAESLALFGLPLSEPQQEDTPSGQFTVQWFERARFELHPEHAPPADVLLGLLGNEVIAGGGAAPSASGCGPIPPPVSAAIHPGPCISSGQPIALDASGFAPRELVSFWLTGPDGNVVHEDQRASGSDGALAGVNFDTGALYAGPWFWVFQGQSSGRQATVHFQVIGGSQGPPPAVVNPTIEWEDPRTLTPRRVRAIYPWTVVDGNSHTHIIYSTDDGNLWYTNTVDGGFSPPQLIEQNIGINREPFYALALGPGNTLHLAYALLGGDHQVYYRLATLSGVIANWTERQRISDGSKPFAAHLAVDGNGAAHIVWIDLNCGNYNVFYRVRTPDGHLSEASTPVGDCIYQNRPQVTLTADGKAHIIFQHDHDIFYARKDPAGWVVQNISNSRKSPSYNATITSDGTALYAAWEEGKNNHDVLFRRSNDGGASWLEIEGFSDTETYASFPNLTYVPATRRVYAVWSDVKDFRNRNPYIVFSAYDPANGQHTTPQRLGTRQGAAILAVVAAGPSVISVVWQDRSRPDWQIYHIGGAIRSKPGN